VIGPWAYSFTHDCNGYWQQRAGQLRLSQIDSARFLASDDRKTILNEIRASVSAEGLVDWNDLMAEVRRTWNMVRVEFVRARPDAAQCGLERMRLTDGKSVVKKLAKISASDPAKWSNHLLETARKSSYTQQFRAELLALTNAA